jgi:hypothetical protein
VAIETAKTDAACIADGRAQLEAVDGARECLILLAKNGAAGVD